mmetsp:Transcript_10238/g.12953  ORF Transcript_10238/g.12953 Transcript_10238/m.12953 type:complete len:151 (-) Transcript_10238:173-625(-)
MIMKKVNITSLQVTLLFLVFASSTAFVISNTKIKRKLVGKLRMMKSLPSTVVKYSQVPKEGFFTANKIPKGLLKEHSTKKGTWGVIKVNTGKLRYIINEPTPAEYVIDRYSCGIIEPGVKHEVAALTDDLEFVVEFHRLPGTGPVDEKRD